GQSLLFGKFLKRRVLPRQLMRNSVGDVLIHNRAWEVFQLRMRLELVTHGLNEWLLEVDRIVNVRCNGEVVAMPREPFGDLRPIAHRRPIAPDVGFLEMCSRNDQIVSFKTPGGE